MNLYSENYQPADFFKKEWLQTNNIGAYASASVGGANTRRYHGLLVASFNPPSERKVLVSRIEEEVIHNYENFELGCSAYSENIINPNGFQYLKDFKNEPFPTFTFGKDNWSLCKKITLAPDTNTCFVQYENLLDTEIQLKLTPFLVCRDYHQLFFEDSQFDFYTEMLGNHTLKIHPHFQSEPLFLHYSKGDLSYNRIWYKHHFYEVEAERGFDAQEDSYSLCTINTCLAPGEKITLVFSTNESFLQLKPEEIFKNKEHKFKEIVNNFNHHEVLGHLVATAESFLVTRQSSQSLTLLAGYHWFLDWGRDTLISIRGIGIETGRQAINKEIISTFLKFLNKGMLPNRFPDEGEDPEYNTVDAALWLFIVLFEYAEAFKDGAFIIENFDAIGEIIKYYSAGTRYNIQLTPKGFIQAGDSYSNLTWMDARVNGVPITPRNGCPVEINMLWYNALKIYDLFQQKYELKGLNVKEWIALFELNFVPFFYNEHGYLNDVVDPNGEGGDRSIRPNQIYALSLPYTLLNKIQAESVLECVKGHLLTDYGLRSLSPIDDKFIATYEGGPEKRDGSYHQGTVWTFLIQEYYTAYLKQHNFSDVAKLTTFEALQPLIKHFYNDGCIGGVAEIFDGLVPNTGKGCVHQAWSVAALISLLIKIEGFPSI